MSTSSYYWLRYGRVGAVLSVVTWPAVLSYVLITHTHPHPVALLTLMTAAVAANAVIWALLPRIVESRWRDATFVCWSLMSLLTILAASELDGGIESPIFDCLLLPVVAGGLVYTRRAIHLLGAVAIGAVVLGALVDGDATTAGTTMLAVSMLFVTVMAGESAQQRAEHTREVTALTEELRAAASRDQLTGCLNRRGFDERLTTEFERARRHQRPLAVAMIDLDGLKQINDAGGHAAGDEAIRHVAGTLTAMCRRSDAVARVGGDEFAVVLPETTAAGAAALMVRVSAALHEGPCTSAVGVADIADASDSVERLVGFADTALYAAKRAGRNQVQTFTRDQSGGDVQRLAATAGLPPQLIGARDD